MTFLKNLLDFLTVEKSILGARLGVFGLKPMQKEVVEIKTQKVLTIKYAYASMET